MVGVTGGTASGKTTICHKIIAHLGEHQSTGDYISMDSFYHELDEEQMKRIADVNFDIPQMFDFDLMKKCL